MDAEAVTGGVRQGIDEPVHHPLRRSGQFRIFAAAGIDRERFATERCGHLVGVETGGVDDGLRRNLLGIRPHHDPVGRSRALDRNCPWQEDHVAGKTQGAQRRDESFGFDDARVG